MVVPRFNTVGGYPSPRVRGFYSLNAGRNFAFLSRFSWAFICLCRHLHCPVIALPRAHPEYEESKFRPPITILKPICGMETTSTNLRSFCRQDYEDFQIVFGVHDNQDAAILDP